MLGRPNLARLGCGQFAGQVLPQAFDLPLSDAISATMGDPGLRLAASRGKRTFRAGGLTYHNFGGGPSGPATAEVLETLPLTMIRRRSLGSFRGTPDAPVFTPPDPEGR